MYKVMDIRGLTGLVKINDSGINNVFHVLAHHPRLKKYYTTYKFRTLENENYNKLFNSFVTLLREYWVSNVTIKPSSFVKISSLVLGKDISLIDFLIFLHMYTATKGVVFHNKYASSHYISAMNRKREILSGLSSFISKEFYGQYITKKKCNLCEKASYDYELFNTIYLSVPKKITSCDVNYLLEKNFISDYKNLCCEGECNMDVPEDGKKNPEHKITTKIFKLPETLIIGIQDKQELEIFPNQTINLERYYNTNVGESVVYGIHAVMCKEYAIIYRPKYESYYMYKDEEVTPLKEFKSIKNPLTILYTRNYIH